MKPMKPRVLGIIPARGGSKRIPNKNIYPILGKPLIWYVIQSAKNSKVLDKVIVSTDSPKIAKIAKECGVEVPFMRPKKLSQDKTPDLPVFQHALLEMEKQGKKYDLVVNLRPTAPMLRAADIDKAVNLLIKSDADSVRSMHEAMHPPYWMKIVDKKGQAHSFIPGKDDTTYPSINHIPHKIYQLNGQVDVMRSKWVKKGNLYGKKMWAYIMKPDKIVDIDTPADLKIVSEMKSSEMKSIKIGNRGPYYP